MIFSWRSSITLNALSGCLLYPGKVRRFAILAHYRDKWTLLHLQQRQTLIANGERWNNGVWTSLVGSNLQAMSSGQSGTVIFCFLGSCLDWFRWKSGFHFCKIDCIRRTVFVLRLSKTPWKQKKFNGKLEVKYAQYHTQNLGAFGRDPRSQGKPQ